MPKLFRRVSVVLLTLLATALPAAGQTPGAIQGRIIDDVSGRPIARSTVSASGTGGEHRATTDDDGRYELARLVPGTYRVYASAPGYSEWQYGQLLATRGGDEVAVRAGEATRRINIRLERAGAISGRIFDSEGNPMPNVEIELLGDRVGGGRRFSNVAVAFAQTDAVGTYRLDDLLPGQYYVRAHTGRVLSLANDAPVESSDEVYTATLFPDATEIAAAQPLRIGPGQELVGIDFELATVPTHTLSGVATNLVGPFFASPLVTATRAGRPTPVASTRVLADGSFELSGLVPGDYELRVTNADERFPPLAVKGFDVVVAGDMTDLVVRAPAVARVRGQIVTDDAAPLPFDPSALGIATEVRPGNGLQMRMSRDASIAPDGSFVVDGVVGPTLLDLSGLPPGWSLLAVRLGGVDITYDPTNLSSGRSDVKMVITGRTVPHAGVTGFVTDRTGRRVADAIVIVFPEDRDRWVTPTRYVMAVRAEADGAYRVLALPSADYLVVAVAAEPPIAWRVPEVLDRLWSRATPLTREDGEQRRLDLRLSRIPAGVTR